MRGSAVVSTVLLLVNTYFSSEKSHSINFTPYFSPRCPHPQTWGLPHSLGTVASVKQGEQHLISFESFQLSFSWGTDPVNGYL